MTHMSFCASEIHKAAKEMHENYDRDIIGKVALAVYRHHKSSHIVFELSEEGQEYFNDILDTLVSKFNLYCDMDKEFSESQQPLSDEQRADVRTKTAELIVY